MREKKSYSHRDPLFKRKFLQWASRYERFCFLDNNGYSHRQYHSHKCIAGLGSIKEFTIRSVADIDKCRRFINVSSDWLFAAISYDMKNIFESLTSGNPDFCGFPLLHLFCPELIFEISDESVSVLFFPGPGAEKQSDKVVAEILSTPLHGSISDKIPVRSRITREDYIETVAAIKNHIRQGDCYELNYCQEFFSEDAVLSPHAVFDALNRYSPAPFAGFYRLGEHYLMCSSPERFLRKEGVKIISQPVKGTIRRGGSPDEDEMLRTLLLNDPKERAENVMIVDLVRNDLSRISVPGSVEAEELFGVYTFGQVHQMISTVIGRLSGNPDFISILSAAFPMGSMTGAPKIKAMELIDRYENSRRGIFSGAVGYINPSGDFDFNVVIRSLVYNAGSRYLSFMTGSAITFSSSPEKEYEECLLKAAAMKHILGNN